MYGDKDVHRWTSAIEDLWEYATTVPDYGGPADAAIANEWAGFDFRDVPAAVITMMIRALEAGYALALRDIQDGDYDSQIRLWRPHLPDDVTPPDGHGDVAVHRVVRPPTARGSRRSGTDR